MQSEDASDNEGDDNRSMHSVSPGSSDSDAVYARDTSLKVLVRALLNRDRVEMLGDGEVCWPSNGAFSRAPLLPLLRLFTNSYFVPKGCSIFEDMRQHALQDRQFYHEHRLHGRDCTHRTAVLRGSRKHWLHQP